MTEPTPTNEGATSPAISPALVGKVKFAFSAVMLIGSAIFTWQMLQEQQRINHRLDVREAYFNKGLIDGAKEREAAYRAAMERNQQIVAFCKKNDCGLPPELETLPPAAQFESLETILTRNREK